MKIGVSAFAWNSTFDSSDFGLLAAVRDHGLEGFEVPVFDPATVPATKIRKVLEASSLECTVCTILPPGINPISPNASARKKAQTHLRDCVATAAELGANMMGGPVYAPIGYLPGRRRNADDWAWAVECLQALGETLAIHAITLALEPVNRSETFFLTTVAEAQALCEAIGNPRIGVLIDTFHANIEEKNISASIHALGPRLKHIHASENDRGVLGTGSIDFAPILRALRETAYDGYLMIEGLGCLPAGKTSPMYMWRRPDETPEQIAFEGAAYLRGLLAECKSPAALTHD
jgi:D-psicose/D-tagatose/L-ribulose 3-epimerase